MVKSRAITPEATYTPTSNRASSRSNLGKLENFHYLAYGYYVN